MKGEPVYMKPAIGYHVALWNLPQPASCLMRLFNASVLNVEFFARLDGCWLSAIDCSGLWRSPFEDSEWLGDTVGF